MEVEIQEHAFVVFFRQYFFAVITTWLTINRSHAFFLFIPRYDSQAHIVMGVTKNIAPHS